MGLIPVWKRDDPSDDDELNEDGIHPVVAEYGEMLIQASEEYERRYVDEPEPPGAEES